MTLLIPRICSFQPWNLLLLLAFYPASSQEPVQGG